MVQQDDAIAGRLVEFLTAAIGVPTVRVTGESGKQVLLHSKYDPEKEAAALVRRVEGETVVFIGTGLGYHVEATLRYNPQLRNIVLVERFPELAARAAARVADVTTFIVGSEDDLPTVLAGSGAPLIVHPPSVAAFPRWYARLEAAAASLTAHVSRGRASTSSLKILVPFEAYYCQREATEALKSLGHDVVTLDYRTQEHRLQELMRAAVVTEKPDLVLCINMRGLDRRGVVADMLKRLGIPLALWFVDSPEFILYGEALPPAASTTIFMWDRAYIPYTEQLGYRTAYLPLAADTALLDAAVTDPSFAAPLSFVGNSLASGFLGRLASRFRRDDRLASLADTFAEELGGGGRDQLHRLEKLIAPHRDLFPDDDSLLFFRAYVLHAATTKYRTALLAGLLPEGLVFFGDPIGWRRIFGDAIDARADVNYFRETPRVYRNSAISINATSFQMPTAVNQRVFDVPLCGGFLLTDRQSDIDELFGPNSIATYGSSDEALQLVKYFLSHPEERAIMADRAKQRVLAQHTYRHRMTMVLRMLFA